MGYICHHAIIVSGGEYEESSVALSLAHIKAAALFRWVSEISPPAINGTRAFFIPPDGGKEGWEESEEGDKCRQEFLDYLESYRYPDNSSPLGWVEVQFRDDDGQSRVTAHSEAKQIR